jgi:hypothetical protein
VPRDSKAARASVEPPKPCTASAAACSRTNYKKSIA